MTPGNPGRLGAGRTTEWIVMSQDGALGLGQRSSDPLQEFETRALELCVSACLNVRARSIGLHKWLKR